MTRFRRQIAILCLVCSVLVCGASTRGGDPPAPPVAAEIPAAGIPAAETPAADAPAAETGDVETPDVATLIDQLNDPSFEMRTAAEQALIKCGAAAVEALEQAARDRGPEVALRAISILERIFQANEGPAGDAAELALDSLQRSGRAPVADAAARVLVGNHEIRERRAVAAIRRLGGRVEYDDDERANAMVENLVGNRMLGNARLQQIRTIWITKDWSGGEEGLRHLRRLSHVGGVNLYHISGSGVSREAVEALAADLQGLQVVRRGSASLGITHMPIGTSACRVSSVVEGGAAQKAGVMPGDIIVTIDEKPIEKFDDLVSELKNYEPGQEAVLRVIRNGQYKTIPVELGGWDNVSAVRARRDPFGNPIPRK